MEVTGQSRSGSRPLRSREHGTRARRARSGYCGYSQLAQPGSTGSISVLGLPKAHPTSCISVGPLCRRVRVRGGSTSNKGRGGTVAPRRGTSFTVMREGSLVQVALRATRAMAGNCRALRLHRRGLRGRAGLRCRRGANSDRCRSLHLCGWWGLRRAHLSGRREAAHRRDRRPSRRRIGRGGDVCLRGDVQTGNDRQSLGHDVRRLLPSDGFASGIGPRCQSIRRR